MDFGIRVFCFVLLMVQFIDSLKNVICEKTNKQTKTKTNKKNPTQLELRKPNVFFKIVFLLCFSEFHRCWEYFCFGARWPSDGFHRGHTYGK